MILAVSFRTIDIGLSVQTQRHLTFPINSAKQYPLCAMYIRNNNNSPKKKVCFVFLAPITCCLKEQSEDGA